mgnify:CR=1 FL=1|jgi:hypothetical protein
MYGDEHFPPLIGSLGDCCPTTRIDSGDFKQTKSVIKFQVKCGLKFIKGCLLVICLTSHLLRVGHATYWTELLEFIDWARGQNLGVDILPTLVPFPCGYKTHHLISICQVYHHLLCASVGSLSNSRGLPCHLWKPFFDSVNQFGASLVSLPAPPISVPEIKGLTECNGQFVSGMRGDWQKGLPKELESIFLTSLVAEIRDDMSKTSNCLLLPSKESITGAIFNSSLQSKKKIFLVGTSILGRAAELLFVLAKDKSVEVVNHSIKGNFFNKKHNLSHLKSGTSQDILFISVVGNSMLNKDEKGFEENGSQSQWHLLNPSMLSDVEANLLVVNLSQLVKRARDNFSGRIFVGGPIPRHVKPCCLDVNHQILDHAGAPLPMIEYTLVLSKFIGASEFLQKDNIFYIDYPVIFGKDVDEGSLIDGVHLDQEYNRSLANYVLNLHDPAFRPPKNRKKDVGVEFSTLLKLKGIYHHDALVDDHAEDASNIDHAINLI